MVNPVMIQAGAQIASAALSGGSGPAGPSSSDENVQRFDNSGWVVNFGSGDVDTRREETGPLDPWLPYVIAGIAGLIAIVWLKRKP